MFLTQSDKLYDYSISIIGSSSKFLVINNFIFASKKLVIQNSWNSDSPLAYQMSLQEPASSYMEGLQIFNCQLLLVITFIVVLVSWLLLATLETTFEYYNSQSAVNFSHSNALEIWWASVPAQTLLSLTSPSFFALIFSMDEVVQPDITLKVFGHQWYWSYEMSDFNSGVSSKHLKYSSYMLTKENLLEQEVPGLFRNFETTRRIVLPTSTHIRLLVTSIDVLHSWAVPSLGIKVDACPGRLNLVSLFIKRSGVYYGQCSEICGINGFMPIPLVGLSRSQFYGLVFDNVEVMVSQEESSVTPESVTEKNNSDLPIFEEWSHDDLVGYGLSSEKNSNAIVPFDGEYRSNHFPRKIPSRKIINAKNQRNLLEFLSKYFPEKNTIAKNNHRDLEFLSKSKILKVKKYRQEKLIMFLTQSDKLYDYSISIIGSSSKFLVINNFIFTSKKLVIQNSWNSDSPLAYQMSLQEPASSYMEGLQIFNCQLLLVITSIVVLVSWLLLATLETTFEYYNSQSAVNFSHSNALEIWWTSVPALILLSLASPSFALLFSMDEVAQPDITLKVFGHQWYWSYEMSDFNSCVSSKNLKYTSYMLTKENLIEQEVPGLFRNLETTRRVVLPTSTHIRLLVTSIDVLHSWAVPSLGIKVDACPGRLNLVSLFIKRYGVYYGQCSEICGINHGFMPISLVGLSRSQFYGLVFENVEVTVEEHLTEKESVRCPADASAKKAEAPVEKEIVEVAVEEQNSSLVRSPEISEKEIVEEQNSFDYSEVLKKYSKRDRNTCLPLFRSLIEAKPGDSKQIEEISSQYEDETLTLCSKMFTAMVESVK